VHGGGLVDADYFVPYFTIFYGRSRALYDEMAGNFGDGKACLR
jgi:hypothetical protein